MADTVEIEIPKDLASMLSSRTSKTQYEDTSEYVSFILREVCHEMNLDEDVESGVDSNQVEDRLKSLGYLSD